MTPERYDCAILGGGPGGIAAATTLALQGKRIVIINDGPMMGYGIEGAFKSKANFEIARHLAYAAMRPEVFGPPHKTPFQVISQDVSNSADKLTAALMGQLRALGVDVVDGRGRFVDAHSIETAERRFVARHIVIATGSKPRALPKVVVDGKRVLDSDCVLALDALPKSLLVLGAGVIGSEIASTMGVLGVDVKLVDSQPRILQSEDEDLASFLTRAFTRSGISVIPSARFESLDVQRDSVVTTLSNGDQVSTDAVMLAVGRTPCSDLGLDAAGVAVDERGLIPVQENMATNVAHIFAVGDVGARATAADLALVHVAQAEGRRAAYEILQKPFSQNMDHVPYIIFTIPMIGGAGLSETLAIERHGAVRVGKYPYGRNHRAHALQPVWGFVKLIVGPEGDDRILGVRAIGREADDLVAASSILIERELPYTYLIDSILPHPSLMECLQGAAHMVAGETLAYRMDEEFAYTDELDWTPRMPSSRDSE